MTDAQSDTAFRILAFSGSAHSPSLNQRLVSLAARGARDAGAEVTLISLRDFPMPLYHAEVEAAGGLPEHARRFKQLLIDHQGLLISSPEHNSSVTAVLKNALDWASRSESGEPPLVAFAGKVAGLVSASPGALGGLRGLFHLREILMNIRVTVLPGMVAVSQAHNAFAEDGSLKDAKQDAAVRAVGRAVAEVGSRIVGG
ncbi:MAG: NAD(P)H-dependent oxidoreductase [Phycisphaerales bacterium]|nr:NAD(P)H-dependent oxidoreductase [Phycisphaerales bacterium]